MRAARQAGYTTSVVLILLFLLTGTVTSFAQGPDWPYYAPANLGYFQTEGTLYQDRGGYVAGQIATHDLSTVWDYNLLPIGWSWIEDDRRFDLACPINLVAAYLSDLTERLVYDSVVTGRMNPFRGLLLGPNTVYNRRLAGKLYVGCGFRTNYLLYKNEGGADRGIVCSPMVGLSLMLPAIQPHMSPPFRGMSGLSVFLSRPYFWDFDGRDTDGEWALHARLFFFAELD